MDSSNDLSDVEMDFDSSLEEHANFTMVLRKFQRACKQVMLLNNWIREQKCRYYRAKRKNQRSFSYTISWQISTLEGVRNAFYEYACNAAVEVQDLQEHMFAVD